MQKFTDRVECNTSLVFGFYEYETCRDARQHLWSPDGNR